MTDPVIFDTDLRRYPSQEHFEIAQANVGKTEGAYRIVGDSHGDLLKIFWTAIVYGVLNITEADYEKLTQLYEEILEEQRTRWSTWTRWPSWAQRPSELPPMPVEACERILAFQKMLETTLRKGKLANQNIIVSLGDSTYDRVGNDACTIAFLYYIIVKLEVPFIETDSNHNELFESNIQISSHMMVNRAFYASGLEYKVFLDTLASMDQAQAEQYKAQAIKLRERYTLIHYVEHADQSLSLAYHAPIEIDVLKKILYVWYISTAKPCEGNTESNLKLLIDWANQQLQKRFTQVDPAYGVSTIEYEGQQLEHPIALLTEYRPANLWETIAVRKYLTLRLDPNAAPRYEILKENTATLEAHGHDGQPGPDNARCLNDEIGGVDGKNQVIFKAQLHVKHMPYSLPKAHVRSHSESMDGQQVIEDNATRQASDSVNAPPKKRRCTPHL